MEEIDHDIIIVQATLRGNTLQRMISNLQKLNSSSSFPEVVHIIAFEDYLQLGVLTSSKVALILITMDSQQFSNYKYNTEVTNYRTTEGVSGYICQVELEYLKFMLVEEFVEPTIIINEQKLIVQHQKDSVIKTQKLLLREVKKGSFEDFYSVDREQADFECELKELDSVKIIHILCKQLKPKAVTLTLKEKPQQHLLLTYNEGVDKLVQSIDIVNCSKILQYPLSFKWSTFQLLVDTIICFGKNNISLKFKENGLVGEFFWCQARFYIQIAKLSAD